MTLVDNPEQGRLELVEDGAPVGWVDYRPAGASTIIAHTEVLAGHEGEGLGGRLVRGAIDHIRGQGKTVIPVCPFATAYIARHPELDETLDPAFRRR